MHPRLLRLAAAAVLITAATATAVTASAETEAGAEAPAVAVAPVNPADYQQVTLARGVPEVGEPMSLAVLPDRSVLHTARNGTVRAAPTPPATPRSPARIPVYTHDEEGLQGVAADPNFATNRYIYLYYAPPLTTPGGDAPATGTAADFAPWKGVNRLSRFTAQRRLHAQHGQRGDVLDVADRPRACAATSAATSTSTRPATSTCPPATTPTRSTRPATPRSTSAPTATRPSTRSAPRATPTTCAARCCGSRSNADGDVHRSRPATCSRRARPTPGPRSTRWASATRSG